MILRLLFSLLSRSSRIRPSFEAEIPRLLVGVCVGIKVD